MKKQFVQLVFSIALIACALSPSTAQAIENLRVATASMTSASVLYLLIAQREGYYRNEGLNVEIINMRGEIAAKIAAVGEIDYFTHGLSGLTAAIRGLPLKILMLVDERPAWDLIVQPNIRSFAQLRDATIGILSFEGSVAVATREMLRRNNLDPFKDVRLMVMGGNDMRFMSLKGQAIQATLLDPANSYRAQKEGFNKLASAGDYMSRYINGGIVAPHDKIRRSPATVNRFMTASLKGYQFFLLRRDVTINHMMQILKARDRDTVAAIYDATLKVVSRDGTADDKVLQAIIEDLKRTTGVTKELRVADLFDFSFVRRAKEQLASGSWNP